MSNITNQNPYQHIGAHIAPGLAAIVSNLRVSPSVDDLVDEVYNFIQPIYYPDVTPQVTLEIKSIAHNVVNSYNRNHLLSNNTCYSNSQLPYVQVLAGRLMSSSLAPDSFLDRMEDIEENLRESSLAVDEQVPLFLTTAIGISTYNYWATELALGSGSVWAPYFSGDNGQNYLNTMQCCVASINGSLIGYGANMEGMLTPNASQVSAKMISAFIGTLTLTAGKLIFNWTPQKNLNTLTLNRSSVTMFGPGGGSPGYKAVGGGDVGPGKPGDTGPGGNCPNPPRTDRDTPTDWDDHCNMTLLGWDHKFFCGNTVQWCLPNDVCSWCGDYHQTYCPGPLFPDSWSPADKTCICNAVCYTDYTIKITDLG